MVNYKKSAFTLVELLVVIFILGLLFSLILPAAKNFFPKADKVVCISHLRNLWIAFSPCASDPTGWPQLPKEIKIGSLEEQRWWIDFSENYLGIDKKNWICPTIARGARGSKKNDTEFLINYLPTLFDPSPGTPNRWPTMPWFIEVGNMHGEGNLSIRCDGTVMPLAR
jgi:prepilin-type N-terminal cleavage/methylation domain-containing protein